MDVDKLAEAIISRIEHDRAIHKSSLVEEIQRAMKPAWNHGMPAMLMDRLLSDGTVMWSCVSVTDWYDGDSRRGGR